MKEKKNLDKLIDPPVKERKATYLCSDHLPSFCCGFDYIITRTIGDNYKVYKMSSWGNPHWTAKFSSLWEAKDWIKSKTIYEYD